MIESNKKIILIGEIHGTKEIPVLLIDFFMDLAKTEDFDIALEIPSKEQLHLDAFLLTGNIEYLHKIEFFLLPPTDGRNSKEYFNLISLIPSLNDINNRHIHVYCIDALDEAEMARSIANVAKKKLFVITGNIHAAIDGQHMAYHLAKTHDFHTVNITAKSGSLYSHGIKSFGDERTLSGFDQTIVLEKVTPATFIRGGNIPLRPN